MRNSDPDAALYWLGRMLEAGEDPLYIARRVVRMAVEDIGLADPNALSQCMAARDAVDFLGMPEGNLALAQAVVYLSVAPKSNALYTAYGDIQGDVERTAAEPVPLHLRNAPTGLMKGLGYGQGYQYAHDLEDKVADMQCLPDNLRDRVYYQPTSEGRGKAHRGAAGRDQTAALPEGRRTSRRSENRIRRLEPAHLMLCKLFPFLHFFQGGWIPWLQAQDLSFRTRSPSVPCNSTRLSICSNCRSGRRRSPPSSIWTN